MEKKHYRIRYDSKNSRFGIEFYDIRSADGLERHGYITNYPNGEFVDNTYGLGNSETDKIPL